MKSKKVKNYHLVKIYRQVKKNLSAVFCS